MWSLSRRADLFQLLSCFRRLLQPLAAAPHFQLHCSLTRCSDAPCTCGPTTGARENSAAAVRLGSFRTHLTLVALLSLLLSCSPVAPHVLQSHRHKSTSMQACVRFALGGNSHASVRVVRSRWQLTCKRACGSLSVATHMQACVWCALVATHMQACVWFALGGNSHASVCVVRSRWQLTCKHVAYKHELSFSPSSMPPVDLAVARTQPKQGAKRGPTVAELFRDMARRKPGSQHGFVERSILYLIFP
jgi:hypothetical protein